MSLLPVGVQAIASRAARDGASNDEKNGLFDLIAAAAAMQALEVRLAVHPTFQLTGLDTPTEHAAALAASPLPAVQIGIQSLTAAIVARAEDPAPVPPRSLETPVITRTHEKIDESAYTVRHGTLPVLVSGQLVELTLLRERRPSRDGGPIRRLSMVLDAATAGSVKVDARVEGDCLVIALDGAPDTDPSIHDGHAREVQALVRRLGWKFTETRWEQVQ